MRKDTIQKKAKELNLTTIEARRNEIEGSPEEVEILLNALGLCWSGFITGCGNLIVRKGYEVDPYDFNSPYSRHHY